MGPAKKLRKMCEEAYELVHGLLFGKFTQMEEREVVKGSETVVFDGRSEKKGQLNVAEPFSETLTDGVRVEVRSVYLPNHSEPERHLYTFAYTVTISNESDAPVKLQSRKWVITDGFGSVQEVIGEGVVGEKPRLSPGQSFQYTSGCQLRTPVGTMHGHYKMDRADGSRFEAQIATFSLATSTLPQSQRN